MQMLLFTVLLLWIDMTARSALQKHFLSRITAVLHAQLGFLQFGDHKASISLIWTRGLLDVDE